MSDPIARLNAALEGRYRIERELGQGGMAIVYLAEDLRHERKVALKVLKPELAAVVGAERFLTEIKTTANLQHPHILPLHDSGEADGFLFFVMPYVEGDTLRDKIDREKQLSLEEAVKITASVAEALDYAHEHGVVHRDIKPSNILLSERGEPTVADFGIALAVAQAGGGRVTETGLSVGTPHYMSPEQATGERDVDPRTDIYALGCVLYEMLTGEPPYQGATAQAVLAKILTDPTPAPTRVRVSIPPNVDAAIRKALEKLPADRFKTAEELARALADPGFRHGDTAAAVTAAGGLWNPLSIAATGLAVLLAGAFAWALLRPDAPRPISRSVLVPPSGVQIAAGGTGIQGWAVSPDGRTVVFPDGPTGQLYRQSLDQVDAVPIPGGERAWYPFFSPDGEWVGYFAQQDNTLRKIRLDGSEAQTLVPVPPTNRSAAWGADGYIVGYSSGLGTLWRVRDSGGDLEEITSTDGDILRWLDLLPGDRAVLAQTTDDPPEIVAVSLDTGERTTLLQGTTPRYVSTGHVVFWRTGGLWAAPFDPERLEVLGPPTPIVEGVGIDAGNGLAHFATGGDLLFYQEGATSGAVNAGAERLVVVDLEGNQEPLVLGPRAIDARGVTWSPDGESIVYGSGAQIYTYNVVLGTTPRQLTFEGTNISPVFSPGGDRVAFTSVREGTNGADLFVKDLNSDTPPRPIIALDGDQLVTQWPADTLIVFEQAGGGPRDLWTLNLSDPDNPVATSYLSSEADLQQIVVSPDLTLAAYTSNESGDYEIYVRSFPVAGERTVVSEGGGFIPYWSPDGNTLYYLDNAGGPAVAAHLRRDPVPVVVSRDTLPVLAPVGTQPAPGSALHPDGDRFIFAPIAGSPDAPAAAGPVPDRLILVQNFTEELRQVVPD